MKYLRILCLAVLFVTVVTASKEKSKNSKKGKDSGSSSSNGKSSEGDESYKKFFPPALIAKQKTCKCQSLAVISLKSVTGTTLRSFKICKTCEDGKDPVVSLNYCTNNKLSLVCLITSKLPVSLPRVEFSICCGLPIPITIPSTAATVTTSALPVSEWQW